MTSSFHPKLRVRSADHLAPECHLATRQRSATPSPARVGDDYRPMNRGGHQIPCCWSRDITSTTCPRPSFLSNHRRRFSDSVRARRSNRLRCCRRTVGEPADLDDCAKTSGVVGIIAWLEVSDDGFEVHRAIGFEVGDESDTMSQQRGLRGFGYGERERIRTVQVWC